MKRLRRREFISLMAAPVAAAVAAACGDDDVGTPAPAASTESAASSPSVGTDAGAVGLRWHGQSMFVITSPGGTRVLLDPFNPIGYPMPNAPLDVQVATISHEHPDHNNAGLAASGALLIRGLTPEGWADVNQRIGDVQVRTVRAFHDGAGGAMRGRNAIFVFETAGLRIAHLGDLGHQLTPEQVTALGGPVELLMVPVGGTFTLGAAEATELVNALRPRLVFPMHYRTPAVNIQIATVDAFLEGKTVQRVGSATMNVGRASLPAQTTVVVLDYA